MFIDNITYKNDITRIANYPLIWDRLENKSILITGASGLIGTFLLDILMFRNISHNNHITIYAVGRNKEKLYRRFKDYENSTFFNFIQQDVQLPITFQNNIDYIIHGASNTHPVAYATESINTILLSVLGTKNILDFAFNQNTKRTIFISTVEIYGENRGDVEYFTEDYCGYIDCNTLRAGYSEGKRTAEALCQAYIKEKTMDIIIARCCRVYGPTMDNNDSKVIAQFLKNACDDKNIVLKSKGIQKYSYCYVADVCTALLVMLINGKSGEAYNIADPCCNVNLLEIAEIISGYIKKDIIFDLPSIVESEGYSKVTKALLDSTKLQTIGWTPYYSIQEGLIRTIDILKNRR